MKLPWLQIIAIVAIFGVVVGYVANPPKAIAAESDQNTAQLEQSWSLTNISPNPEAFRLYNSSQSWGGSVFTGLNGQSTGYGFKHLLKNENSSIVKNIRLVAYFSSADIPAGANIDVWTPGGGNISCRSDAPGSGDPLSGDFRKLSMTAGGVLLFDRFFDKRASGAADAAGRANGAYACDRLRGDYFDISNLTAVLNPQSGLHELQINLNLSGGGWTQKQGDFNQARFQILVPGALKVGLNAVSSAQDFGIVESFGDEPYGLKVAMPFGMACNEPSASINGKLSIYDGDFPTFGNLYMRVLKRPAPDPGQPAVPASVHDGVTWNGGGAYSYKVSGGAWNNWWAIYSDSDVTSEFTIQMDRGWQYMVVFVNPNQSPPFPRTPTGNVLSIQLPSDSVYGDTNCSYKLTPSVDDLSPESFSYDANYAVTGRVASEGYVRDNHTWQLSKITYSSRPDITGQTNGFRPCNWKANCQPVPGGVGSTVNGFPQPFAVPYNYQETNVPVGTWVCFMMSVSKPTWLSSVSTWAHSDMKCVVSGTSPKVQVRGYDLKAGGKINTSVTPVGASAKFGSWGEYGVLSNGVNRNMGSGSGLLGGVNPLLTQSSWSSLTFANAVTTGGEYGLYGGVTMPVVSGSGVATILGGGGDYTMTALPPGPKTTYKVNGTLFINQNLTYGNNYASVADIPQIKLIADNIVIGPGVTRIDPWLVAMRTDGTYGKLSTCSQIVQAGNYFVPLSTPGLLYAARAGVGGVCTNPLQFNGPVIAGEVYPYRTYDVKDGSIAAETFNLNPSNFLSSYVGGGTTRPVATTDLITELPPRF